MGDIREALALMSVAARHRSLLIFDLGNGWEVRRHPDKVTSFQVRPARGGWTPTWGTLYWAFRCAVDRQLHPSAEYLEQGADYTPTRLATTDSRDWSHEDTMRINRELEALGGGRPHEPGPPRDPVMLYHKALCLGLPAQAVTVQELAQKMKWTEERVQAALPWLRQHGYLGQVRKPGQDIRYYVVPPPSSAKRADGPG
jgi:hypothetical protein